MDSNDSERRNGPGDRPNGGYGRRMRASDADRAATAERLRQHYTEGRLDAQEYDERIERCYAAKTVDELDDLFMDLPRAASREPQEASAHRYHGYPPPWRFAPIAVVVVALIVASILTGTHLFILVWPLLFFTFGPFGRWRCMGRDRWHGRDTTAA